MHDKYRFKFDAAGLIDTLGGAPATTRLLRERGADVTLKAVQKMRERNVIQGDALASLMVASYEAGAPINPYNFILERNDDA